MVSGAHRAGGSLARILECDSRVSPPSVRGYCSPAHRHQEEHGALWPMKLADLTTARTATTPLSYRRQRRSGQHNQEVQFFVKLC